MMLFVSIDHGLTVLLISGFTLTFAALLNLSTRDKRHEQSVAIARCCAVLVIFLSNTTSAVAAQPLDVVRIQLVTS